MLLLGWPAWSQPKPEETRDPAHDELIAMREGMLAAMAAGDIEKQLTFLHPNVVVTWHNAEVSRGHQGVRDYLDRYLSGPEKLVTKYSVDLKVDELSILYGGDTAIAWGSGLEHFSLANGPSFDLEARWSATVVKEDDRWLIANLHVSDNLFDNPLTRAAWTTTYWAGGGALLLGLVIGVLLGRKSK